MKKRIYAAYRGDEYRGDGTLEQITAMEGVSFATARFAATKTGGGGLRRRRGIARRVYYSWCLYARKEKSHETGRTEKPPL